MAKLKLPKNSMGFVFSIDPESGEIFLNADANMGDDLLPQQAAEMMDLFNGLSFFLDFGVDYLAYSGAVIRELDEERLGDIEFEPDEELLDAASGAKIIPINGKKRPH